MFYILENPITGEPKTKQANAGRQDFQAEKQSISHWGSTKDKDKQHYCKWSKKNIQLLMQRNGEGKSATAQRIELERGMCDLWLKVTWNCKVRNGIFLNTAALAVSKLKGIEKEHFRSENYCWNDKLQRNGSALIVKQDVARTGKGYNETFDQIISIGLYGKSNNISIIQVYGPPTDAEEEISENFYLGRNWSNTKTEWTDKHGRL